MKKSKKRKWGRHFSPEQIEDARRNGRLLAMELETSHRCNLRCVYCYNRSGKRLHNELATDEIFNTVDQAVDLGLQRAVIIGGGEPLMHPDIMDIIAYLRKKDLAIELFTNGILITEEVAKKLYDFRVEPVVKFNSLRPEVQDLLADVPGTFGRIQKGLDNLTRAGYPDDDHEMGVESIVCSHNYNEIPTMWRWARDRDLTPYFEMITFQGRAGERAELNVSVADLKALFEELSKIDREEYGIEWIPHPPIAAMACNRHEYSCTVDARGYVMPCPGVNVRVGNIRHGSLREILSSSPVIQALRGIRENVKGACSTCDQLHDCYGCRGMAYHIAGDILACDPLCWHNPNHLDITPVKPSVAPGNRE